MHPATKTRSRLACIVALPIDVLLLGPPCWSSERRLHEICGTWWQTEMLGIERTSCRDCLYSKYFLKDVDMPSNNLMVPFWHIFSHIGNDCTFTSCCLSLTAIAPELSREMIASIMKKSVHSTVPCRCFEDRVHSNTENSLGVRLPDHCRPGNTVLITIYRHYGKLAKMSTWILFVLVSTREKACGSGTKEVQKLPQGITWL